ncbi:DAZ-associated protein 1 [Morus notabilis]|uniref:DAZ-associated protein 1 n=1 Tax=Morus notabilis TaxID=981085 RepID=W9RVJ4_9ROSA|nr:DAZ-associated protein 1 [Morus notabilis]
MKIFIGGLPHDLSQEELKSFFGSFGTITDIIIIHNKETNRSRGFGFVTFDSEEVTHNVLQNKFYFVKSKRVEVKKAEPKERVLRSPSFMPFHPNLSVDLYTYFPPYPQYYYNTYNYLNHYGAWFGGNMNYYWPESRFGQNPFYPYDFCTPGYYYYSYNEHSRFGHTTN